MQFNIILNNVAIKTFLDTACLSVKVNNDFGGIVISHEEAICSWIYKGEVYRRRKGARIYVGAWAQCFFPSLGVDCIIFHPQMTRYVKRVV